MSDPTILAERVVSQVTHLLEERTRLAARLEEIDHILAPFVEPPPSRRRRKAKGNGTPRVRAGITEETREKMRAAWQRRKAARPVSPEPPEAI